MDTRTHPIALRIARIRDVLKEQHASAVLIPSSDPHLSEYLPQRWQGREWASGFTGSMGTLVVSIDQAVLFADSRYWSQAEAELRGTDIALEKIPTSAATPVIDWLAEHTCNGHSVLVDGQVLALAAEKALRTALDKVGATLRTDVDVFDTVWEQRPGLPQGLVYEHLPPYATQTRAEKLTQVRAVMAQQDCSAHFISSVDDIAWLLNLRGSDVSYNPVFIAHLLLSPSACTLFIADGKIDAALRDCLAIDGVCLPCVESHGERAIFEGLQIPVDPQQSDRVRARVALGRHPADGVHARLRRDHGKRSERCHNRRPSWPCKPRDRYAR